MDKEKWEEEFDNVFPKLPNLISSAHTSAVIATKTDIKSFIAKTREEARAEVIEEVRAKVKALMLIPQKDIWGAEVPKWECFNDALREVLLLLSPPDATGV